jgi:hypothetical protein
MTPTSTSPLELAVTLDGQPRSTTASSRGARERGSSVG